MTKIFGNFWLRSFYITLNNIISFLILNVKTNLTEFTEHSRIHEHTMTINEYFCRLDRSKKEINYCEFKLYICVLSNIKNFAGKKNEYIITSNLLYDVLCSGPVRSFLVKTSTINLSIDQIISVLNPYRHYSFCMEARDDVLQKISCLNIITIIKSNHCSEYNLFWGFIIKKYILQRGIWTAQNLPYRYQINLRYFISWTDTVWAT